jgi:predicted HTH domain antitoxin
MIKNEKVVVEISPALAAELATAGEQLVADLLQRGLRDLRMEQALERYKQGDISFAAVAELAGVSQSELARAAYVRGIEPFYDEAMVAEELA